METKKKKVLISGAGVAGMVCAALLDKNKFEVEVIEKADSFRNIGFSIVVWRSGFELLREFFTRHDHPLKTNADDFAVQKFVLFGGLTIAKLREFDAKGFAWVFYRQHLMEMIEEVLFETLPRSAVSFSKTIANVRLREEGQAEVTFCDHTKEDYDLVIVAEGIYSMTRALLFEERIVSMPWRLIYAWFATPTNFFDNAGLILSKGHAAVIHPPHAKNLLGFYFPKGAAEKNETDFEKEIFHIIKSVNGSETSLDLKTSQLFDLREIHIESYAKGNVVLIGDAAHGRPPTIGFGTSLAVEDAVLLSRIVNGVSSTCFQWDIAPALQKFSELRTPRVASVYRIQALIHWCITDNPLKVDLIAFASHFFLGWYVEMKMKALARYRLPDTL